ncbi:unnamed protein product [Ranitomeya imitator]|uniref:sphingomyelin phosphodiesterase n=1 Tax=Ranitomeya imitator TaxID=111125 RepID=A0ABN9MDC2_9NEOB|nr:unnamed protein product [Ranitomeya imitator]
MFTLVTGIVGRWRAVCVTALQRPNSDAAAIRIVVGIAAASLNVKGPLGCVHISSNHALKPAAQSFPALTVSAGRKVEHSGDVISFNDGEVVPLIVGRWRELCDSSPATTRLTNDHGQVVSLVVIVEGFTSLDVTDLRRQVLTQCREADAGGQTPECECHLYGLHQLHHGRTCHHRCSRSLSSLTDAADFWVCECAGHIDAFLRVAFSCRLLEVLFHLSCILVFPSYWFIDRLLSCTVSTSAERSCALRILCLVFGVTLFVLLFVVSLPLCVLGPPALGSASPDGLARFSNLSHTQRRATAISRLLCAPQEAQDDGDSAPVCSAEDILPMIETPGNKVQGGEEDGPFEVQLGETEQKQKDCGIHKLYPPPCSRDCCLALAAPGDAAIRCDQMSLLLQWVSDFQAENSQDGELVAFDVLCGDLNFDNCSSDDCLEQKHKLFSMYKDPCRDCAGQDRPGSVGTLLRQELLYHEAVNSPTRLKSTLQSHGERRQYVASPLPQIEGSGDHWTGRRIDYILYREADTLLPVTEACGLVTEANILKASGPLRLSSPDSPKKQKTGQGDILQGDCRGRFLETELPVVDKFQFIITRLAGLSDHIPVSLHLSTSLPESSSCDSLTSWITSQFLCTCRPRSRRAAPCDSLTSWITSQFSLHLSTSLLESSAL